jgi:hypothetical protein
MAMQDVIGQASAMTGGYGNSYAASVGSQAYQASLENLNDIIPELYQMAYDKYNQEGQDMVNKLGVLANDYERSYGEWADGYNRLEADRGYWGTEAGNAFNRDWGMYDSNRTFEQGQHNTEQGYLYQDHRDKISDEQWLKSFEETKRQYNETMAFNRGQANKAATSDDKTDNTPNNNPAPNATSTKNTDSFIGNHQTKDEFMARGDKTYKQYIEYIEGKINEAEGSLSDEEIAYLIKYYGLS